MTETFLLALVAITSVGAHALGRKKLGLSGRGLLAALGKVLEGLGATLGFLIINVAGAVLIILVLRSMGRFVSVYLVNDVVWVALSLLQGLTFQWWRELSGRP